MAFFRNLAKKNLKPDEDSVELVIKIDYQPKEQSMAIQQPVD